MPFSILSGKDNSFTGIGLDRADIVGDPYLPADRPTSEYLQEWFNTQAFTYNASGTFGDTGPDMLRGPRYEDLDFALIRNVAIPIGPAKESQHLEFRAEFYNLFNQPNFGLPSATLTSPTFGKILSAGSPRIIQLALKFVF